MRDWLIGFLRAQRKRLRERKILRHVDRQRPGLEIGPSHSPVVPKREGFNVRVLDHANAAELRSKYQGHGVHLDRIEEVDYVWSGQHFVDLVGAQRFGWIIASHVIEHAPDLIRFINDCEEILDVHGVLSLAIPDKRYCFDHYRERSSLGSVIDAHLAGRVVHSVGSAAEHFLHATRKGRRIAWNALMPGRLSAIHSATEAREAMQLAAAGKYLDVHAWCFTPSSFRLLIEDLHQLGYIRLREIAFFGTTGHEFFVILSREGAGPNLSRDQLLVRKEREA